MTDTAPSKGLEPSRLPIVAALGAFAALGVYWGSWASLVPAIKLATGAGEAQLGLALLATSAGALPALVAGGPLVDRLGSRVMTVSLAALAVAGILPGFATSPVGLAAALLVVGFASAALDVSMNVEVSELEARGVRLMHGAHASFSVGMLVSSAAVGVARGVGAEPPAILASVAVVLAGFAVLATRAPRTGQHVPSSAVSVPAVTSPDPVPLPAAGDADWSRRLLVTPLLVVVGVACGLGFVLEAGLEQWGAVHLEETLGAHPAVSGLGPAAFAFAMIVGRLGAQWIGERANPWWLLGGGAAVGGVGVTLLALAPNPALGIVGMGLAGIGLSSTAPVCFGLAGELGGRRRGAAMSTVTTLAYMGSLLGPAGVGLTAQVIGKSAALVVLAVAAAPLVVLALVGAALHRRDPGSGGV